MADRNWVRCRTRVSGWCWGGGAVKGRLRVEVRKERRTFQRMSCPRCRRGAMRRRRRRRGAKTRRQRERQRGNRTTKCAALAVPLAFAVFAVLSSAPHYFCWGAYAAAARGWPRPRCSYLRRGHATCQARVAARRVETQCRADPT